MRFESKAELDKIHEDMVALCEKLTIEKKENRHTPKEYNCKVDFDYRIEYDNSVETKVERHGFISKIVPVLKNEKEEDLPISGDIYIMVYRQPSFASFIKIMGLDGLEKNVLAWDSMVDKNYSSEEIFTDRVKCGMIFSMIGKIDALSSDKKKE